MAEVSQNTTKKKQRKCKGCKEPVGHAGLTARCFACINLQKKAMQQRSMKKSIAKAKKKKKVIPKYKRERTLKRKCWELMSRLVREGSADWRENVECYTCGILNHWKEMHAGHYQHSKLDFDPRNINPQCPKCNTYQGGRLDDYTLHLIRDNGVEWVEELKRDAARHTGYKEEELKEIYKDLKEKVSKLYVRQGE